MTMKTYNEHGGGFHYTDADPDPTFVCDRCGDDDIEDLYEQGSGKWFCAGCCEVSA